MSRPRRTLIYALVLIVVLATAGVLWRSYGERITSIADLHSLTSDVQRLDGQTAQQQPVDSGVRANLRVGDGVTVDSAGRARLTMNGCVLEVYRNSGLKVDGIPSRSAPVCAVHFSHGTIYNRVSVETIVTTEWAVIQVRGTDFLVHVDDARGLLWVIVRSGEVDVEAEGRIVHLSGGEQTWIRRGQPGVGVLPATRGEVGDLFPTLEELTGGEMDDTFLLRDDAPPEEPPPDETPPAETPPDPPPDPLPNLRVFTLGDELSELVVGAGEPRTVRVWNMPADGAGPSQRSTMVVSIEGDAAVRGVDRTGDGPACARTQRGAECVLGRLEVGDRQDFTMTLVAFSAGSVRLTMRVEPDENATPATATWTYTAATPQFPDLVVDDAIELDGGPDGCLVTATVSNISDVAAGATTARVTSNGSLGEFSAVADVPLLQAGESVSVETFVPGASFCQFDPDSSGVVVVDPDRRIQESNEGNNATDWLWIG